VVEKSGAWFSFQGERIGQGRENARTFLEQHPAMLDKIEALVLAKHGVLRLPLGATPPPAPAEGRKAAVNGTEPAKPAAAEPKRPAAKAN
jgi:recombination protein RecA